MMGWETTNLSLLNDGRFEVSDPGPLHAPIGQFSIRRNDALKLILEIEGPGNATSRAIQYPAGTVRISAETVELVNVGGVKAVLSGVEPFSQSVTQAPHGSTLRELARVHEFTITTAEFNKAAYTIEWLENLPRSPFIWPDLIKTVMETNISHRFASTDDAITLLAPDRREMSDRCAAKLTVGGNTFFICALQPDAVNGGIRPGCIVYLGTPSDLARKQIRAGLSFALGSYLIELGHTFYDEDWSLIGATSRSAYSPYGNAPHPSAPLAPLGNGRFRDVIDRSTLSRIVNAFVHAYDRLDLGGLSWAYWHACVAPVHSAPAQFGAAIEALQRVYIKSNPASVKSTILSRAEWKDLRANMEGELNKLGIHEDSRAALIERLNEINRAPQRAILKAVMRAIGLELGSAEDAAWARRNRAAHGMPIPEDDVLAAIRDTKLLKVLFHRLLLSCADASDAYIDYVSLDHPYRRLQEPVPDAHG